MKKEGQVRIPSGCAIAAVISKEGKRISGNMIIEAMKPMHDRSNGLGGGFSGYGIYPEYKDYYALHIFYDDEGARVKCEELLFHRFDIIKAEVIPTRKTARISDEPKIWRYFAAVRALNIDEDDFVANFVVQVNTQIEGAYVFSSGKNMGTFKAVGYPEDVGEFYQLENYEGYCWIAHGRYPTNTPGWWGGAHPFSLLNSSIVHNGEISSYDANRRYIEMFGYKCTLQTDTEVITYMIDYLVRKLGFSLSETANILAAPFWSEIDCLEDEEEKKRLTQLRIAYSSLLITGPFSIILGFDHGLMALNDRLKLRSMVVGEKDDFVYIASEEASILAMNPDVTNIWAPKGGEVVIVMAREDDEK
ncbi:MAG: glutamine amidotransferase family protein [Traorella sp.]